MQESDVRDARGENGQTCNCDKYSLVDKRPERCEMDPAKMTIEAYRDKMEAQLLEWEAQLKAAQSDAKFKSADAQKELEQKMQDVRARLEELKTAGAQASQDVMRGLRDAATELQQAWDRATG